LVELFDVDIDSLLEAHKQDVLDRQKFLLEDSGVSTMLQKEVANIGIIPLVYIGGGGDLHSHLIGADPTNPRVDNLINITDAEFFETHDIGPRGETTDSQIWEFKNLKKAIASGDYVPLGAKKAMSPKTSFTHLHRVEPAAQMLFQLKQLDLLRSASHYYDSINQTDNLIFSRNGQLVKLSYRKGRVNNAEDLRNILSQISPDGGEEKPFGLLVKGTDHFRVEHNLDELIQKSQPRYVVIDDPTYFGRDFTVEDGKKALQELGYKVQLVDSSKASWGYPITYRQIPSKGKPKTIAIIAIKENSTSE